MAGNSFGDFYRITSYGESHGHGLGVIIDGCPSGLELDIEKIQHEMDRRKPGQSDITSQRKEKDVVHIRSGIFNGRTTGAPIMMEVINGDVDSSAYENIKDKCRPGHADHTYHVKYGGFNDWRGGGRSSARETVARVMGGAVAKQVLEEQGVKIFGCTVNIGGIEARFIDYDFSKGNKLRCPDRYVYDEMLRKVEEAKNSNNSVGGAVEVVAYNVPIGLGEPVFDKLNAALMHGLGSIGAVKAVSIGMGSKVESMLGSDYNDEMRVKGGGKISYLTNHAGGIIGGISNGEPIVARLSVKPTPTRKGVPLILPKKDGSRDEEVVIKGRHDPVIMPRLVPVAEAMMAIVLTDFFLKQKAYSKVY